MGEPEKMHERMAQITQVMAGRGEQEGKGRISRGFLPDVH